MENKSINKIYLIFLLVFSVLFISVAYATFNSELNISGDISIFTDTTAPTCGTWYLRDSSLTIQDAYDQNKFINPSTNTNWTNTNKKLFIECSDNMSGSFGCINVTEITDSNNNKRYFKEVKEYTTSIKTDSEVVTVTLQDAYLNSRTCTLPVGGSNPYIDKQGPTVTITQSAANKFTYSATDDMSSNVTLQYMVTTSSTTPSLNDSNWSSNISEVTIDNSAAHTYYVWAKDGVNITHQTISTFKLTKTQGTGTTLTLRYNNSSGATLSTGYVLNGTKVYAVATPSTGYNTAVLKKGSTTIATGTGTGNATSTQTISGATTISSSASANTYLVNYDANGGSGSMASQLMTYGTSTALSTNTFAKTGYTFAGWNTSDDGTGTNYTNGQSVSNLVTTNNGSITLYAKWTAIPYTIIFDPNSGTMNSSTSITSYTQNYGTTITMNNPTRTGYEFMGWVSNQKENITTAGYWTYDESVDPLTGNTLEFINDSDHRLNGYAGGTAYLSTPKLNSFTAYVPSSSSTSSVTNVNYSNEDPNPLHNINSTSFTRITRTSYKDVTYSNGPSGALPNWLNESSTITFVVVARITEGWNLYVTGNDGGNINYKWHTSQAGTGDWETYVVSVSLKDTNKTMNVGHMYLRNTDNTTNSTHPTIDVAYEQAYYTNKQSNKAGVNKFMIGVANETLKATWRAVDQLVTITPNNANGSYKVTANNLFDKTAMISNGYKIVSSTPQWAGASYITKNNDYFISEWIRLVPGATYKISGVSSTGLVEWSVATGKSNFYSASTKATEFSNNTTFTVPTTYVNTSGNDVDVAYQSFRFHAKLSDIDNITLEMVDSPTYNNTQTLHFPNNANVNVIVTPNAGSTATVSKTSGLGAFISSSSNNVITGSLTGVAGAASTTNLAITYTGKSYTVTANANGGSIASSTGWTGTGNTSTKSVTYDAAYGTLPTVSRTGYTFVGWVDNLVPDVTAANYNQNNFSNRTPYEFKTDGSFGNQTNQPYIRFNGTQQSTNIDTSYSITTKNNIAVEAGKTYTLSFYVRSKNAVVSQYMSSCASAVQNCTKITWNDATYTKLPSAIKFDNDGNWHLITQTITVPSGITSGTINIGNDNPNLYGTNSYMDIGGVSLTLSSEPNLIITSETIVKTPGNHNIYAHWTASSYTIAYAMNNGNNPDPKPTSGNYNEDVVIGSTTMPTKTITVTGNANSTGATIGSATATVQTFAGWTSTQAAGLNSEAKTGTTSNPSTAWDGSATTNKYFRNLGTAGETVTLTATWSGTVNLPTVEKTGYTCKWYSTSGTTGGTLIGNSGGTWTPDSTSLSAVTIYARCTPNSYTVTANANGGSIASTTGWTGTGNTSTKSATYDAVYGTLPTVSKKGYVLAGWSLLPDGYTQVEYIQSTGTQYIDTGINPSQNTKVEFSATPTVTTEGAWFGSRNGVGVGSFNVWQTGGTIRADFNTQQVNTTSVSANTRYNMYMDKAGAIVNGTKYNFAAVSNFSGSSTFTIFALKGYAANPGYNSADSVDSRKSSLKLYYVKIWDGNTLSGDYVPCINNSTGKAGLYDIVNGVFYGNANASGDDFIAGNPSYINAESIVQTPGNHNIYAKWTPNSYTIAYAMNNGNNPSPKPTSGTYDSNVVIGSTSMPTKTITVTGNANSTGATVGSSTATVQTFAGWTSNSGAGLGTGAKTGTSASPSTAWDGSSTTNKYFKNLRDTSGTVTLTANWSGAVNLPTVTKAGYVCKWYSTEGTTGGTLIGNSGGTWTPDSSSTAAVTVYARCTPNVVTVNVKNGTSASTKGYSLSLSTNNSSDTATYTATNSNGTVTFSGVANGTYYIYSGKNSNALSTRLYTGKTVTVSNNSPSAVTVQYYGLTLAIGTGITSVSNGGTATTNAVEYLYNSSSLQSIAIDATVTSGYTWSTWTASGTTLNTYTAGTKSQNVKMGAGATTLTASAVYSSTPVITTTDHNTFSVSANSGSKYLISKTQTTKPEANASGWSTTSTQDVSTTAKETWYVWAKDANGNVSNNYATITNYVITLSAGTGTTLTAKANTSSGTTVTNGMYVLSGSTVYPTGALSTGYKTLVIQKNGSTITNSSGQIIEADTTFATSATPNTYSITLNNQSATSAGTTKVWYRYNTATNGCYYYTDSSLTTCLTDYTITKPTKTGYTFGGYYTSTNGGGTIYIQSNGVFTNNIYQKLPSEINSNYTNDITLYAKWTANTYTIAYAMNNGSNPNPKPTSGTYNSDVAIGTTTAPSKTVTITPNVNGSGASIGSAVVSTQTFTGWTSSTAAGLGTGAKTGTSANPSTAWAGAATTNKYFKNLRDTSGTVTLTANWSGSVTLPTVTKTGHTCSWYDTEGTTGGNLIGNSGGSYTVPSNSATSINIYARCTPNSYTLTINPNGGSWNGTTSNTTVTQNYGTTYSIDNNPTRAGYVFTGWTKSGTGTYNYYDTNSGTPSSTTTMNFNSASSTLPNVYNNKGNGTVTRAMVADSTATGGYSLKITTNGEANPNAGGISASIIPTTPSTIHVLEMKAKIPTGYNINLVYGNYNRGIGSTYRSDNRSGTNDWNTYYLVYYGGDTGTFSPLSYIYLSGSDNTSVTWYVDYITIRSYTRDQAKSLFTFGAGNGTLTANWAASGSMISFKPDGGVWDSTNVKSWTNNYYNVSTTNAERYYRYNTAYGTFPSDNSFDWTPDDRVITKEGYTFGGWYTAANGGGTQIFNTDGTLKTSISGYSDANGKWIKYDSNVTLYARWIPNSYTITYDLHNGTNNANNPSSYTIESNDITLSAPTRSGYTFDGWSSNNLFDMNATPYQNGKYVRGDGQIVSFTAGSIYKINVNPNTTYTIVNSGGCTSPGYAIYNSSDTRLAGENYQNRKVITFTTPANASYILVSVVANYYSGEAYRYDKNIFELYETNGLTSTYDTYVTKTIPTGSMGDKSFTANWSKEMSDLTITLSQNSYTYDGSAKTPTVTVKDGSTTLTKDVDYKVSYSDNTNAGTGTVTITTLGAYNSTTKATYTGTTDKTFTINRQAIAFPTCSDKAYTASEQTLFEAHSSGNYTNAVIKGTTVGEYTGTLTPASNYQWSTGDNVTEGRTLTCNIVKSDTTTTLANITKTYNGSNQAASGATAKLNSNNTSISGAAFTYKYYTNNLCNVGETTTAPKNAGTYYVKATLTGTTNYETSTSNCATYTMNSKKTTITYNYNNAYQITFANGEYAETGYYIDWDNDFTISGVWKYPTAAKRYLVIGNNSDGTKTLNIEATTENKFRIYMGNGGAAVDAVSSTTIGRNVDITYTYSWVASTHTYTFTATGSSTNISMTGTASTMTGVSAIPLRYGTRDNTNSNSVFTTTTYHKTLNITKVYTADGTNTLDISTASKPAYTFNGWYTASTGGTAVSNETLVPATNTTYYAQWTPNTFQVKFNANGGSGTMANESFTFDQAKALTANAFVRDGYTFVGWSNNSTTGATSGIYYDGQSVSNLTKTNNATVNLYALWRSNGYQVVYDGNGNTSGSMSNQNMTYGTAGTLTANGFTKTGYTFNNWKTSTSTTGVSYNNQASININPNMITGTSAPAALPTSSVTTGYAYSGRWARTSTSITPTIVNMTDTPSSLITNGFNIPSNTTSANYYMYVQYMLVDYNQPYTLSVYAKGSGTLILRAGNSTPYKEETFTLTDTWTRYSMKVIPVNSNTAGTYNARTAGRYLHNIGFGTPAGNGAIQVAGVKFEIGDTATEYTDSNNTLNLHAQWTPTTYTIAYAMNNGANPNPKPTSGTYNSDVAIGTTTAPTKSVTFTPNANGTDANMGSAVVSSQTFSGWSSSTSAGLGSNAKTGTSSNPSTTWAGATTTNKYFKNLRDTSGTVTLTANWSGSVTLPTVTKAGCTCKWYDTDGTTGGNLIGNSGGSYTVPSNSSTAVTIYARCTPNPLTFNDKTVESTYNETTEQKISTGVSQASNGSGTYTYDITAGNTNNYFRLDGRHIMVAAGTPANAAGYQITITARDSNTGATKEAKYTIIVNKHNCVLTTSAGPVTPGDTVDLSNTAYNVKGELSYAFKSGGRQTTTPSTLSGTNNKTFTAGAMSAANDTNQPVDLQITDTGDSNYKGCTKDLVLTVKKKTNTLASNNHTVYVTSENNYSDLIRNNNGGELTATITSDNTTGGVHDTTNKKYTAGVLSASNDADGSAVFSVTSHRTTTVAQKTVNSTLTVEKYSNTLAADDKAVYVTSSTALTNFIKNQNGGELTVTKGKDNTSGSSISNGNFVAGELAANNDADRTVALTYTSARTTTVKASGNVNVTVTVQKYENELSWTGSTPANNATLGYGGSYTATATPANNGGTNGAITYTSGTTATMTINSSTGAITVKKADGSSSVITASMAATTTVKAKTLTRTFKTGKGTCAAPTNIAIATDKKVTWTASPSATSYQACVATGSNTCTPSTALTSGSAYNAITDETGTRTVYVRSVCDTTYYTSANSSNASASKAVYSVSLTKGTGISAVSGAGNYITGASASINATVSSGYTWTNWTGSSTISTKSTSVTVNANKSYTANATANTYAIAYAMNNGSNPNPKPTSGIYDSDVVIGSTTMPTKTITVTGNANSTGATIGSATATVQTFAGWTSNSEAGLGNGAKTGTSASPSTAWDGSATTNKYFKNLRDTSGTVTLTANWSGAVNLPTATKEGYTCKWYSSSGTSGGTLIGESGGTWTPDSSSTTAVTVYARCTINQYTLTINPNGGSYNGTTSSTLVTQDYASLYTVGNNPTKAGYVFNGWTLSGAGTYNPWKQDEEMTDVTSFNYNSSSSTLPGVYNNGTSGAVTRQMVSDSTASGGYSLKVTTNGTASPGAGGINIANGYPTTSGRINVVQVLAKIPTGYTLNLNGIGEQYTGVGSTSIATIDNSGTGQWKYYSFVIYTGDAGNFQSNVYLSLNGSNNTSVTWNISQVDVFTYTKAQFKSVYQFGAGNATLTANWQPGGAKVTFNANGGTFNSYYVANWTNGYYNVTSTSADRYYYYDTAYDTFPGYSDYNWTPDYRVIDRGGYTFDGWYLGSISGNRVFLQDGTLATSVVGYSTPDGIWRKYNSNVTLYAHWTPRKYAFTLDKQSGSGGTDTIYEYFDDGWYLTYASGGTLSDKMTTSANPITKPTRIGYTFGGYYTGTNGSGTQIINANGYVTSSSNTIAREYESPYTLYAKWTANTYTVEAQANGGSMSSATTGWSRYEGDIARRTVNYDSTFQTVPTPTRSGKTFDGWYNNSDQSLSWSAGTGTHSYKKLAAKVVPGATYTVKIGSATRTAGSATQFTVTVYDHTTSKGASSTTQTFGSNKQFNVSVPADWNSSDDISILIYCGLAGSTNGNTVNYSNIRVSSSNLNGGPYTGSSVNKIPGTNYIYAHWK